MTQSFLKLTILVLTVFCGLTYTAIAQETKVPHTVTLPGIEDAIYQYASPESLGFKSEVFEALTDSVLN